MYGHNRVRMGMGVIEADCRPKHPKSMSSRLPGPSSATGVQIRSTNRCQFRQVGDFGGFVEPLQQQSTRSPNRSSRSEFFLHPQPTSRQSSFFWWKNCRAMTDDLELFCVTKLHPPNNEVITTMRRINIIEITRLLPVEFLPLKFLLGRITHRHLPIRTRMAVYPLWF